MADDPDLVWRKRLGIYSLARLGGLVIFFLGVLIMFTNFARTGGWPQLGAILAIVGVLLAMLGPRLLKRSWDREDASKE